MLTIFVDGCTDFLFDKAVPNPHYIFRITNIQSADGATAAIAAAKTWPSTKRIAHIHPDYSYGRNAFDHYSIVTKKLLPNAEVGIRSLAEAGNHGLQLAHHQDHCRQARSSVLLGVGRGLCGDVQAGAAVRPVRQDESCDLAGARRRAPRHRQGSPGGCHHGRALELLLHVSARRLLAATTRRSSPTTTSAGRSIRTSRPKAPTRRPTC